MLLPDGVPELEGERLSDWVSETEVVGEAETEGVLVPVDDGEVVNEGVVEPEGDMEMEALAVRVTVKETERLGE